VSNDDGLFPAAGLYSPGRVELALQRSLEAAKTSGALIDTDEGLAAGALVAARALDRAEALPDKSSVYAIAQLMRPYQDALHALGLPVERAPVPAPTAVADRNGQSSGDDLLRDLFGTPSDG
jgi:hypothetical protein